eukprot:3230437-Rhodomonas_salina.1
MSMSFQSSYSILDIASQKKRGCRRRVERKRAANGRTRSRTARAFQKERLGRGGEDQPPHTR